MKYANALAFYERQKPPHLFMFRLYLEAAHACRREVNGEIAIPGLQQDMQDSIGKSIRRVNWYVQNEGMDLMRLRGDRVIDPSASINDPIILDQAIQMIVRKGEMVGAQRRTPQNQVQQGNNAAEAGMFSNADMLVLFVRHAGVLDRMGRYDEALKALDNAAKYVPESLDVGAVPDLEAGDKQRLDLLMDMMKGHLALIRGMLDTRRECLKRERDYLFKAARANLAAVKFREVELRNVTQPSLEPAGSKRKDPGTVAFLMGELLRRAGEDPAALAMFATAERIAGLRIATLDRIIPKTEESDAPRVDPAFRPKEGDISRAEKERDDAHYLRSNIASQRRLIRESDRLRKPEAYVQGVIDQLLLDATGTPANAAGELAVAGPAIPEPTKPAADVAAIPPGPAQPAATAPAPAGAGSREVLFKKYHAAIMQYRKLNQKNPDAIEDVVKAGLISEAESCLEPDGKTRKIRCPETGEKVIYFRSWEPGEADKPILFSSKVPLTSMPMAACGPRNSSVP